MASMRCVRDPVFFSDTSCSCLRLRLLASGGERSDNGRDQWRRHHPPSVQRIQGFSACRVVPSVYVPARLSSRDEGLGSLPAITCQFSILIFKLFRQSGYREASRIIQRNVSLSPITFVYAKTSNYVSREPCKLVRRPTPTAVSLMQTRLHYSRRRERDPNSKFHFFSLSETASWKLNREQQEKSTRNNLAPIAAERRYWSTMIKSPPMPA